MVTFIDLKKQIPEEGVPIDVIINNQSISAVNNRFPDVFYRNGKFYTIHLEIEIEGVTHWMYSPTIKSVTNCVTCGSECDVNTDGTTHYYISKTEHFKSELKKAVELIKLFHSLPDLLSNSLGDCSEGNDYEIISINGERWINHKCVGSGEPLKQWIKSEIDKALDKK